ncbi:MAG: hypothetical protein PSX42_11195 [bacterium]|nr:hypothetical protein [bacterium]
MRDKENLPSILIEKLNTTIYEKPDVEGDFTPGFTFSYGLDELEGILIMEVNGIVIVENDEIQDLELASVLITMKVLSLPTAYEIGQNIVLGLEHLKSHEGPKVYNEIRPLLERIDVPPADWYEPDLMPFLEIMKMHFN